MTLNAEARRLAEAEIEAWEKLRLNAYLCSSGVPTIGIGMTRYPNGSPVRLGDVTSEPVARRMFQDLLEQEYIPAALQIPGWNRLGAKRQAALLSFMWNLGSGFYGAKGFETVSRVLKQGAVNPLAYKEMPAALNLYVRDSSGRVSEGLVNRRKREGALWSEEDDGMISLKANQDTFIKKAPIEERYLTSGIGKIAKPAGTVIQLTRLDEVPRSSHDWATIYGQADGPWAIFGPHWSQVNAAPAAGGDVDWRNFSARVSEFLTVGEVLRMDARRRPAPGSAAEKNILAVAQEFDAIRRDWGGPIGVTSGYRPEPINTQVGGASQSRHITGEALDIYPVDGRIDEFHAWLKPRWSGGYGDGRADFIHIDIRNGGKFNPRGGVQNAAFWLY